MVFATSSLRLSGAAAAAARRLLTCREEVPLRDRRLRRLRRVRNLLPNEIAFLQPSHCQFVQRPRAHFHLEYESNRRARAVATSPPFYYTFCNGCGNRNCFLGHPRAEGLLLLALWFLITAPRGSSPGNKLEVPLRARTKPTLIPTALPREPSGGKKRQVPPTHGRTEQPWRGRRRRKCSSTRNEQDNQSGRGFLYRRHREGGRGTQKGTQKGGRIRRALSPLHFPGASSFWTKTLTVRPAFLTKKAENGRLPFGLSFPLGS